MKSQAEIVDISTTTEHWDECMDVFLRTRRSEHTRKTYRWALLDFLASLGRPLTGLETRLDVLRWTEAMQQRSLQPSTIKTRVTALRSFFAYAQEYRVDGQALCRSNPVEGKSLRPKVRAYGKARALTQDEVQRLLGAVDLAAENGARDYAMLAGFLVLGRRNSEWRLARVVDFEATGGEIFYRWCGKGKEDQLISVPHELWRVLQAYIAQSGGRGMFDYIFLDRSGTRPISSRRMLALVKRYASLAGLGDLRVHDLRHTATMLRRLAGADVDELREFLGHSSIQTTQVYIHRIERVADTRGQAVARKILNHRYTQIDTDGEK